MTTNKTPSRRTGRTGAGRRSRGFTLIELLVVVAIIALLIGVLLPALASARGAAWELVSNARKRDHFQSINLYGSDYDQFIPGVGTSGLRIKGNGSGPVVIGTGSVSAAQEFERANRDPSRPTSAFDWASPALVADNLPANRAERMWFIWEQLGDPAMQDRVSVYLLGSQPMKAESIAQVNDLIASRGESFPGVSFLMPSAFQYWGQDIDPGGNFFGPVATSFNADTIRGIRHPFTNPVTVPTNYTPRITAVGTPSDKIALADGFRYHEGDEIDFDPNFAIGTFGGWTDSSPIVSFSTAYGLPGSNNPSNGLNIPLSYRHRGKMGAVHFDGSAKSYTIDESHNPHLWYPTRSRFTGVNAIPAAQNFFPPQQGNEPRFIN